MLKHGAVRYLPVRVVMEIVVIVRERDRDEGELESLAGPMRGSEIPVKILS